MYKIWIASVAASIGLAGWTNLADADLFSAKGPVIAILADDLFLGEAEGHLSGAGTLAMQSQKSSAVSCLGQFTSSAALGGSGQMRCSDGATGTFHFQRLSMVRGYGAGSSTRGSMSFTYGLTAVESESYLKLPPGKKLAHSGNKLELVDISPPQAVAPAKSAVAVAGHEPRGRIENVKSTKSYEIIIRMADGSSRVIDDAGAASWRIRERLIVIGGVRPSNR